jgi:Zn-dependent protease with chaperone function
MQASPALQQQPTITEQACPECHSSIPVHPYYVAWCDQCEWNLYRPQADTPNTTFDRLYAAMGKRTSQSLFDAMIQTTSFKPRLTLAKMLASGLACIVHSITIAFAVLGILLLIHGWPNIIAIVFGLICLGGAWLARPQVTTMPEAIIPRDELPTLYKIVDAIADALGTSTVTGIMITSDFNATFTQVGWRRKKVISLGWPLWTILSHQERIALLSHEMAHGVNGDANRGFFIATAIDSLINWHDTLMPERIWPAEAGLEGLIHIPVNLALLAMANVAWCGAYLLIHLLWQDHQRSEYLADYLAAEVSGTNVMLALLEKLHLDTTCELTIQRLMLTRSSQDVFDALQQQVAAVPARELDRIRRVEQQTLSRLDVTHPATVYRVKFLQAHPVATPRVSIADANWQQLETELAPMRAEIQQHLSRGY